MNKKWTYPKGFFSRKRWEEAEKLVNADELDNNLRGWAEEFYKEHPDIDFMEAYRMILNKIQSPEFPVVDAVPVVRCKNCHKWQDAIDEVKIGGVQWKYCPHLECHTEEDFFCKDGFEILDIHGPRGKE